MPEHILILGGTPEARLAAEALAGQGKDVVLSLAGVTREAVPTTSRVRRGGFGGTAGLVGYLRNSRISLVIDATHPFAAQMSAQAHAAAAACGIALMRLERPAWEAPQDGVWQEAETFAAALGRITGGSRVLVTTGRKNLDLLASHPSLSGMVRCIEAPAAALPAGWLLKLARPPFSLEEELSLMRQHRFTHLLCKNSGGGAMHSKVRAANLLGLEVSMIARPAKPPCETFASPGALLDAVGKPRAAS